MSLSVQENVELKPYTTFRMGGRVAFFCEITSRDALVEYISFAQEKKLPLLILGGGSNIIFPDQGVLEACVGLMKIDGFEIVHEEAGMVEVKIGAGEVWDEAVGKSVELGLSGIEAMSGIPGSTGALPIQNVGAYGQETKDALVSAEVYDRHTNTFTVLSNEACQFSYRDSIFKHEGKERYVVVSITLRLSRAPANVPAYPGVQKYFEEKGIVNPVGKDIRTAVTEIRWTKLPDPKLIASCGSFFINPFVTKAVGDALKAAYSGAVLFEAGEERYKVGAGWLIDTLGLKGKEFGNLSVYKNNALVLVNRGGATQTEVKALVEYIQSEVQKKFGIRIEPEPVFVY